MSTSAWVRSDTQLPSRARFRPRKLHAFLAILLIVAVAGLGWLWYRGSSFVKITHVTVVGLSGPDVPQIRAALTQSALAMTTMNVQTSKLDAAVAQYSGVSSLSVTTDGNHALVIHVNEQIPVALVTSGGQAVAVDGYGRLLSQSTVPHGALPTLPLASPSGADEITSRGNLAALKVLQAAPYAWLAHVQSAQSSAAHGVVLQLRNGPEVYFGPANQLGAKWTALSAVLQDSQSAGAAYIDVSDPQRPAAGVAVTTTATTSTTTTATGTSSTG